MLLGVGADGLTLDSVLKAWKQQVTALGAYPEQGGANESNIYINSAKDTLVRWIEGNLGPGQGPGNDNDPLQPSGVPRKP
jgi:hypothetical protein